MYRALRSILCSRLSIACTAVAMLHLNLITTCFPAQPPVCHLCCYVHDAIVHRPLHVQRNQVQQHVYSALHIAVRLCDVCMSAAIQYISPDIFSKNNKNIQLR